MSESYFETFLKAVAATEERDGILGGEHLYYPLSEAHRYLNTPVNAVIFGAMGVDGVHYAILAIDGEVRDDSPVIQVSPMDFSDPYSLMAMSFLEFLSLSTGVSASDIQTVFSEERESGFALVPFLREYFRSKRMLIAKRGRSIESVRDLIQLPPESA